MPVLNLYHVFSHLVESGLYLAAFIRAWGLALFAMCREWGCEWEANERYMCSNIGAR